MPFENVMKVEECINVIVFNSVNEIFTYMLMLYLARKTYVTRASVYGIVSFLFVIFEGVFKGRFIRKENHHWYISFFTVIEIVLFLTGYTLIFFERVTVKNIAKFQKISKTVRYIKEVEEPDLKYEAIDYRKETMSQQNNSLAVSMKVKNVNNTLIVENYIKRPVSIN